MPTATDLYDASASGAHGADHVDVRGGGGAMPLQGLSVSARHGEAEGRLRGQELHPEERYTQGDIKSELATDIFQHLILDTKAMLVFE